MPLNTRHRRDRLIRLVIRIRWAMSRTWPWSLPTFSRFDIKVVTFWSLPTTLLDEISCKVEEPDFAGDFEGFDEGKFDLFVTWVSEGGIVGNLAFGES